MALRAAPDNLSASVLNGCQVNLTWNAVDSATSYNIKRSATSGGPYTIIKNTPGTSFEDKRLPGDTIYFYTVSALNSAGQSVNSAEVRAATQKSSPALTVQYEMEDNTADSSPNGYHAAADLSVLTAWWLWLTDNCPAETDRLDADIDGSGAIDLGDFAVLAAQWLRPL